MHFDPSYFQGETRNDFYIRPMVKRAWAAQMEVLHDIDIICKRHNIMYYAEWGTLLGAIRHQGFVPWDDDMDIGMRRKDFARFQHYAKTELPEGYEVLTVHNFLPHDQMIVRVVNSMEITTNPAFLEKFHGCPYITGVDIFISDNVPLNKSEEDIQLNLVRAVDSLSRKWDDPDMTEEERSELVHEIEELCNYKFTDNMPLKHQLLILEDRLCSMYWDDEAEYVTLMPKLANIPDYKIPVSCYESTIEVPFENMTIPVPVGYHQILTRRYGNYMIEWRGGGSHEYPFYLSQQKKLFEEFHKRGMVIPDYLKE